MTSGLGASFPPGLVVGKVTTVAKDDGMFQRVEVAPAVDVSRVRAVEVLLAPPPPPDPDAKNEAAQRARVRRESRCENRDASCSSRTCCASIVAAVWRFMPGFTRDAVPAIGALTAAYLGHTTRPHRAPSTAGSVVLGYLIDVICGTPPGLSCARARR